MHLIALFTSIICTTSWSVRDNLQIQENYSIRASPDIIYHGGHIVTMDDAQPVAEAIAIEGDKIVAVGSNNEILSMQELSTQIVDLHGLTMLPGFNDAHCHWFSWRQHVCTAYEEDIVTHPELEAIMEMLSANGWTSISELAFGRPNDGSIEHLQNAQALEAAGKLSVRVNGYWGTVAEVETLNAFADHPPDRIYSDRIRAQGIKMYVDDPFGTSDILTQEEANAIAMRAHTDGWQIAVHAVNISGIEKMLNAFELVLGAENNDKYRHRIEHAVKVTDNQLERMLSKGIIASFQIMGPPDWPEQQTHVDHLSNTNPHLQMRWREFVDADLPSVASTDAPFNNTTCDYNPFRAIHQGVTRMGYLDREHAQWELDQKLTIAQCVKLMTIDAAYATKEEDIKGSLSPGKYADLIVVSSNPLDYENNPDLLFDIEVIQTMVGGEIEFCRDLLCSSLCEEKESFKNELGTITVSRTEPGNPAAQAFDDDLGSIWSAGSGSPQWVQIDFERDRIVRQIELVVSQFPDGSTAHHLEGARDGNNCNLALLKRFEQVTRDMDILIYQPVVPDTLRYLRLETVSSPSWVSWYEIRVDLEEGTVATLTPTEITRLDLGPVPSAGAIDLDLELAKDSRLIIDLLNAQGIIVDNILSRQNTTGRIRVRINANHELSAGLYLIRIQTETGKLTKRIVIVE